MKHVLKWSTFQLEGGWVLIGVDVSLEREGEPEALLGYRRAVHPLHLQVTGNVEPVIEFFRVITEMTQMINSGLMGVMPLNRCPPRVRARLGVQNDSL